jgi:hypothetical protein
VGATIKPFPNNVHHGPLLAVGTVLLGVGPCGWTIYLDAQRQVEQWEASGDFEFLRRLGLEGKRHPVFPAPTGVYKKDFSASAAAILRAARASDDQVLLSLRALLHGGRTKRLPLAYPQWVSHPDQKVEVKAGKLVAPRVFTYAPMGVIAADNDSTSGGSSVVVSITMSL